MKDGAFVGDAIEVGSLVDLGSVSTDGLQRMVIGKHEDDVGPFGFGRFIRGSCVRQEFAEYRECNRQRDKAFRYARCLARNRKMIHGVAGVSGGKVGRKRLV